MQVQHAARQCNMLQAECTRRRMQATLQLCKHTYCSREWVNDMCKQVILQTESTKLSTTYCKWMQCTEEVCNTLQSIA